MATSVVNPRAQFFANNGRPLIGGRIHTYVAGSSTRARTYKDAAKAQPNTNPIILDGRGEAQIYLAEGVEYKFVFEDSKGALIYTQEPVYGAVWPNAAEWPSDATLSYRYMTEARAAADASGVSAFFDTYAQASLMAPGLSDGAIIEIAIDETKNNARTRYKKEASELAYVVTLGVFLDGGELDDSVEFLPVPTIAGGGADYVSLNAQAAALASRTKFNLEKGLELEQSIDDNKQLAAATALGASQNAGPSGYSGIEAADFLSNFRNTVDGQVTTNVTWLPEDDTDAKKLIKALTAIPSGNVFGRISLFNSAGANVISRPVLVRPTYLGHASVGYVEKAFGGNTFYVCTVGGDWVSSLRQTVYKGTMRTLTNHLANEKILVSTPYPRLAFNTSPSGTGEFPTYIANGRVIHGSDDNPYFISSAYITSDGRFEVVPHIGEFTKVVTDLVAKESIYQSFHFRYVLVKDGAAFDLVGEGYTTIAGLTANPSARTIIGQKANGTLFVAACNGKTGDFGATIQNAIDFALSEGCVNCFNLDGGGSTTFMSRGEIKNTPSDTGGEREIPMISYLV